MPPVPDMAEHLPPVVGLVYARLANQLPTDAFVWELQSFTCQLFQNGTHDHGILVVELAVSVS
jgi:hypothetical protein